MNMRYIGPNIRFIFTKIKELMNSHNTDNSAHSELFKSKFDSWALLRNPTDAQILDAIATIYKTGFGNVLVDENYGDAAKLFFRPSVSIMSVPVFGDHTPTLQETKGIYITTSGEQGQYIASHTDGTLTLTPATSDTVLYTAQSLTDEQKSQARTNIGAYTKPTSGIPKTDLSNDVQKSLTGADQAVEQINRMHFIQMEDNNGELLAENKTTAEETHALIMDMINTEYTVALMYQGVTYLLSNVTNIGSIQSPTFSALTGAGDVKLSQIKYQPAGTVFKYILTTKDIVEDAVKCKVVGRRLLFTAGATVSGNVAIIG